MKLESTPHPHADVAVHAGAARLEGILTLPEGAKGLVLFAHGSGSSRLSPRNQYVAGVLELNEAARRRMRAKAMLEIVPGATHLFEETGNLERAAGLARRWFQQQLDSPSHDRENDES